MENDEIFVEFITGAHDAFVIEDADHVLAARADGNADLHRFLAVADGVVRALEREEARRLIDKVCGGDERRAADVAAAALLPEVRNITLAAVFRAMEAGPPV